MSGVRLDERLICVSSNLEIRADNEMNGYVLYNQEKQCILIPSGTLKHIAITETYNTRGILEKLVGHNFTNIEKEGLTLEAIKNIITEAYFLEEERIKRQLN